MRIRYNELIKRYGQKGIKVKPRRPFKNVRDDDEALNGIWEGKKRPKPY